LRDWVKSQVSPEIGDSLRIIYGGTVNKENADEFIS
jgi:triosephosphate isomerase